MDNKKVAIIGGGSIGVAFAIVFASSGAEVRIQEPSSARRTEAWTDIQRRLSILDSYGLLEESVEVCANRVSVHDALEDAIEGADLVQECVPEDLDTKRALFSELATKTPDTCVLASSTSFIPSSESTATTGAAERTLVAHPGNPPYAIPIIELVPNPSTRPEILVTATEIYSSAGMSPVVVQKETEGFIFNRIQGAVLREAYALVREGIASTDEIDQVVKEGLARRWIFMGPFETADLNTRGGIAAHAQRMGPFYHRMGLNRGDNYEWTTDLVSEVVRQRRQRLNLEDWESRVAWRDDQLLKRLAFERSLPS